MGRYDLALKIGAEFWRYTVEFILNPSQWSALTLPVTLNWNIVRFSQNQVLNVPNDEVGVYSFVVKPDIANHSNCSYLMYVGQTTDQSFRMRYRQYLQYQRTQTGSFYVVHMLNTWPEHLWFCYASVQQPDSILEIEEHLISAYLPPANRSYPAELREPMALWRR